MTQERVNKHRDNITEFINDIQDHVNQLEGFDNQMAENGINYWLAIKEKLFIVEDSLISGKRIN